MDDPHASEKRFEHIEIEIRNAINLNAHRLDKLERAIRILANHAPPDTQAKLRLLEFPPEHPGLPDMPSS